eukprot:7908504-Pyramimonas_sp.AAC.1
MAQQTGRTKTYPCYGAFLLLYCCTRRETHAFRKTTDHHSLASRVQRVSGAHSTKRRCMPNSVYAVWFST